MMNIGLKLKLLYLVLGILAASQMFAQDITGTATNLVVQGAALTPASQEYTFTEGPAVDLKGNVYFTDQPNDRILKWSKKHGLEVWMQPSGRANGLYFDDQGNLLACADEHNQLWKIGPDKQVTVLIDHFDGKLLNGPNDLWIDPSGGIYFTDPFYQRDYWDHSEQEIEQECVYYLPPGAGHPRVVDADYQRPNGIIGTPDGKKLYVADIQGSKINVYDIAPNGDLQNRRLFAPMGSDGMTLDNQGNVYLTGDGVTVFNPSGEKILHIQVPEQWTANVTFGGKKEKTLFITAMKSLYTLEMNVHGVRWNH
ncbi:MAG: SMP-30/gluconolactonase/LRE family protein [Saprospiraceae bacterium]